MLLSNFLVNGTTIQGQAGPSAINANDVLLLDFIGRLFPVNVSDYAAVNVLGDASHSIIAPTSLTAFNILTISHKEVFVAPSDGSIFESAAYLTSSSGHKLFKYSTAGLLLGSIILESTASAQLNTPCIQQLSNGNIVVTWVNASAAAGLYFEILDVNLNVIVAKTSITATPATVFYDMIALSGGGFAVAYPMAGGINLAVYSNAGATVYAGTAITSSPTAGGACRMVQLSNGNIAAAINSSAANKALGYAISTILGAQVLAYTVSSAATSGGSSYPEISTLTGFFAVAVGDATNATAYVYNNAGSLQGGGYSVADANVTTGGTTFHKLLNDGSNFWYVMKDVGIAYIPVTGTNFFLNSSIIVGASFDAILERGIIVFSAGATAGSVVQLLPGGSVSTIETVVVPASAQQTRITLKSGGDFAMIVATSITTNTQFCVQKYLPAAVVGVSQTTIAAGNAGTLIAYAMGPGGYPSNAIAGSVGKSFDHSSTSPTGNKGVLLGNSVSLKGI